MTFMTEKVIRRILYFWTLFIGIGAVGGAACMLIAPDGSIMKMQDLLPYFEVLPFSDLLFKNFIFPGISLLIVNGLTQLITFLFLKTRRKAAPKMAIGCGVILMLWITIQFIIFPLNFMSTIYFIFGFIEAAFGVWLYVRTRKEGKL